MEVQAVHLCGSHMPGSRQAVSKPSRHYLLCGSAMALSLSMAGAPAHFGFVCLLC